MDSIIIGNSLEYPGTGPVSISKKVHTDIIAGTGSGKSTLMMRMIKSDFYDGNPVFIEEPHGSLSDEALHHIPRWRGNKVVVIDPTSDRPVGINPLSGKDKEKCAENTIDTFMGIWPDAFLASSENITSGYLNALLEVEANPTLIHLYKMMADWDYCQHIFSQVKDSASQTFFKGHSALSPRERTDKVDRPMNKVRKFVMNKSARLLFGNPKPIDIGKLLNEGYIIIVKITKGALGEDLTKFLLSVLVGMIKQFAYEREAIPYNKRSLVRVYIDELANCTKGQSVGTILSETRKYNVFLTEAYQFRSQLPEEVADSIYANVGNQIVGRIASPEDAAEMAKRLQIDNPEFLQHLATGRWEVSRVENGQVLQSKYIQGERDLPIYGNEQDYDEIIKQSARRFGCDRQRIFNDVDRILRASFPRDDGVKSPACPTGMKNATRAGQRCSKTRQRPRTTT